MKDIRIKSIDPHIRLKNMDTTLEEILELLHNEKDGYKYECNLSRPNANDFRISIVKIFHDCFICHLEFHKKDLEIRQDARVQNLFTPKMICRSCCKSVDNLLDSLKLVQPTHLKNLNK